jgi:hypothetical protein
MFSKFGNHYKQDEKMSVIKNNNLKRILFIDTWEIPCLNFCSEGFCGFFPLSLQGNSGVIHENEVHHFL